MTTALDCIGVDPRILEPEILDLLLMDQTMKENIVWGYETEDHKTEDPVTTDQVQSGLVLPRFAKEELERRQRTRKNAEVFTPPKICREMIDALDVYFSKDAEEGEDEDLSEADLMEYLQATWLEITCGEAPFLISRYEMTTGVPLKIPFRYGILDRKLYQLAAYPEVKERWYALVLIAYRSVYGYELLGDNVCLARMNLLQTFLDYSEWAGMPSDTITADQLKTAAEIISWNIWQMDGLTGLVPSHGDGRQTEAFIRAYETDPETFAVTTEILPYTSLIQETGIGAGSHI